MQLLRSQDSGFPLFAGAFLCLSDLFSPGCGKQVNLHPSAPNLSQVRLSGPRLFSPYLVQMQSVDQLKVRGVRLRAQASLTAAWPNGNLMAGRSSQQGYTGPQWDVPAVRLTCRKWTALWKRCGLALSKDWHMEIDDEVVKWGVAFPLSSPSRVLTVARDWIVYAQCSLCILNSSDLAAVKDQHNRLSLAYFFPLQKVLFRWISFCFIKPAVFIWTLSGHYTSQRNLIQRCNLDVRPILWNQYSRRADLSMQFSLGFEILRINKVLNFVVCGVRADASTWQQRLNDSLEVC